MQHFWTIILASALALSFGCGCAGSPVSGTANLPQQHDPAATKALILAVIHDDLATVERLVGSGVPIGVGDPISGRTPLHWAAMVGHTSIATWLLDHGAPVEARADRGQAPGGQTPLYDAAFAGQNDVVALLITRGARIDVSDGFGEPIFVAAANPNNEGKNTLRLLLDAGCDVNQAGNERYRATALHWAAYWGMNKEVELLLSRGANPLAQDNDGQTPRDWALKRAQNEAVQLLDRAVGKEQR